MQAKLMRYLGGKKFCVALSDTHALVCVECDSACPSLASAGPFRPINVEVSLGEYQVQQGYYKGSSIVAPLASNAPPKTTTYKRVRQ
jgi:hypothetical protein